MYGSVRLATLQLTYAIGVRDEYWVTVIRNVGCVCRSHSKGSNHCPVTPRICVGYS